MMFFFELDMEVVEIYFDNEVLKIMVIDSLIICKFVIWGEIVFFFCKLIKLIV